MRQGAISSTGPFVAEFERRWADYCGRRYGCAVSSGTAALQVAVACLGLKPGDEVIMPTFTIISCALAVAYSGAVPVLVDAEPHTWCLDVEQIRARITSRTRAIMVVHIYGHPVALDPVLELAERHGLSVIEDAAEAHGAEYRTARQPGGAAWRRCGSFGTVSTFSFYANKTVTTGEGGMLLTDDPAVATRAAGLRNLCFDPRQRFVHMEMGFNFRMTNLQAAVGLAQLEQIDDFIERKRWIAAEYTKRLAGVGGLQLPAQAEWARSVCWMYGIVLSEAGRIDAAELAQRLAIRGVETRPFFFPMHQQPVFLDRGWFRGESYPVAERLGRRGLYLPSGVTLSADELEHVAGAVHEALRV